MMSSSEGFTPSSFLNRAMENGRCMRHWLYKANPHRTPNRKYLWWSCVAWCWWKWQLKPWIHWCHSLNIELINVLRRVKVKVFLDVDLKSYVGREPRKCFGVIESEHPRFVGHQLVKEFMKKVFDVDIASLKVPIKKHLEDQRTKFVTYIRVHNSIMQILATLRHSHIPQVFFCSPCDGQHPVVQRCLLKWLLVSASV